MPKNRDVTGGGDERWAHFRFSVIGPLLAAPPRRGEELLGESLQLLEDFGEPAEALRGLLGYALRRSE